MVISRVICPACSSLITEHVIATEQGLIFTHRCFLTHVAASNYPILGGFISEGLFSEFTCYKNNFSNDCCRKEHNYEEQQSHEQHRKAHDFKKKKKILLSFFYWFFVLFLSLYKLLNAVVPLVRFEMNSCSFSGLKTWHLQNCKGSYWEFILKTINWKVWNLSLIFFGILRRRLLF